MSGWWPDPHTYVLSARDLARPVHGTWLRITQQGCIAILTNYHEDTCEKAVGACSRGAIVNSWLALPSDSKLTTQEFVSRWTSSTSGIKNIGGFNLVCGKVGEPLAVLSNRVEDAIAANVAGEGREDEDRLIQRLLAVLSIDTLPRLETHAAGVEDYMKHLSKSIFVPVVGPSGEGGTKSGITAQADGSGGTRTSRCWRTERGYGQPPYDE